jgi:hypothetical protein
MHSFSSTKTNSPGHLNFRHTRRNRAASQSGYVAREGKFAKAREQRWRQGKKQKPKMLLHTLRIILRTAPHFRTRLSFFVCGAHIPHTTTTIVVPLGKLSRAYLQSYLELQGHSVAFRTYTNKHSLESAQRLLALGPIRQRCRQLMTTAQARIHHPPFMEGCEDGRLSLDCSLPYPDTRSAQQSTACERRGDVQCGVSRPLEFWVLFSVGSADG